MSRTKPTSRQAAGCASRGGRSRGSAGGELQGRGAAAQCIAASGRVCPCRQWGPRVTRRPGGPCRTCVGCGAGCDCAGVGQLLVEPAWAASSLARVGTPKNEAMLEPACSPFRRTRHCWRGCDPSTIPRLWWTLSSPCVAPESDGAPGPRTSAGCLRLAVFHFRHDSGPLGQPAATQVSHETVTSDLCGKLPAKSAKLSLLTNPHAVFFVRLLHPPCVDRPLYLPCFFYPHCTPYVTFTRHKCAMPPSLLAAPCFLLLGCRPDAAMLCPCEFPSSGFSGNIVALLCPSIPLLLSFPIVALFDTYIPAQCCRRNLLCTSSYCDHNQLRWKLPLGGRLDLQCALLPVLQACRAACSPPVAPACARQRVGRTEDRGMGLEYTLRQRNVLLRYLSKAGEAGLQGQVDRHLYGSMNSINRHMLLLADWLPRKGCNAQLAWRNHFSAHASSDTIRLPH